MKYFPLGFKRHFTRRYLFNILIFSILFTVKYNNWLRIEISLLTQLSPMFYFYTLSKSQKTIGFLTFSRGAEIELWAKTGYQWSFLYTFDAGCV